MTQTNQSDNKSRWQETVLEDLESRVGTIRTELDQSKRNFTIDIDGLVQQIDDLEKRLSKFRDILWNLFGIYVYFSLRDNESRPSYLTFLLSQAI